MDLACILSINIKFQYKVHSFWYVATRVSRIWRVCDKQMDVDLSMNLNYRGRRYNKQRRRPHAV